MHTYTLTYIYLVRSWCASYMYDNSLYLCTSWHSLHVYAYISYKYILLRTWYVSWRSPCPFCVCFSPITGTYALTWHGSCGIKSSTQIQHVHSDNHNKCVLRWAYLDSGRAMKWSLATTLWYCQWLGPSRLHGCWFIKSSKSDD